MEWKKNGPLPFLCFFLEVFANKHPLSLSFLFFFFFHFILELFYNEYLLLFVFYSYYSSFFLFLFSSFLVWRYSLVNTSKNKMKKRIILFLFLLKGVHQQASSFSSFLHYNEYLLFTFFSPSYSSYFLFFHFFFGGVIILIFLSSIFFTSFF